MQHLLEDVEDRQTYLCLRRGGQSCPELLRRNRGGFGRHVERERMPLGPWKDQLVVEGRHWSREGRHGAPPGGGSPKWRQRRRGLGVLQRRAGTQKVLQGAHPGS